ncbi:hypothetical protein BAUR920_03369 [Brevibacterium aurantiacum]|uniref:Uncharacterized protein n=1 Tax=Brevibacterium aurantiacum TaxID=273384 RepID=A0A2H1KMR8_BREAU|nr:hypothetical protein BAUR920_03369 [Brevibacterium aurantiacum]
MGAVTTRCPVNCTNLTRTSSNSVATWVADTANEVSRTIREIAVSDSSNRSFVINRGPRRQFWPPIKR